ncbi:Mrp8p [Sugiyamaella lignohabitans]|uniref:Mrp8p n=1 Tax=Sugiyamaella lignohabitans TaxID=796027 RepID=A0A167EQ22_9ASCO|nr:Mrp8p [Sugiyamaella lignohabitans]ANB14329.1 Mrp8p [Sugiyamaella lignohabitans]
MSSAGKSVEPVTVESLKVEVEKLATQVRKNTNAIIDTGRHVLSIQIEHEKQLLAKEGLSETREVATGTGSGVTGAGGAGSSVIDSKSYRERKRDIDLDSDDEVDDRGAGRSGGQGGSNDAITSEDIVDLVTELQGQLDMLDERSVRRTANAFVAAESDPIAPLPGRDGEFPAETESFPATLGEFKALDTSQVEFWLKWYELLPPDEEELAQLLDRAGATLEDVGQPASTAPKPEPSIDETNANFDSLARFLGIRARRTKGVW